MGLNKTTSLVLVLGIWLGASILLLWVVGSSFPGVEKAVQNNEKLAERAGFEPGDSAAKKISVPWVVTGELNRQYFAGWNIGQLVLAGAALLCAARCRQRATFLVLSIAALVVLALSFWLAPAITEAGRSLDFVPRDPPPAQEASFMSLHRWYTGLEVAKVILLVLAVKLVGREEGRDSGEAAQQAS
ncbi:MAG: hypothetical protein VX254_04035, partial [Planctomycetota bacterium]|nr:hypothetical protein [Planctomycetota bacterium]